MPTIELTDEQSEYLQGLVEDEINAWSNELLRYDTSDPDYVQYAHRQSVLSDILHLLEIA